MADVQRSGGASAQAVTKNRGKSAALNLLASEGDEVEKLATVHHAISALMPSYAAVWNDYIVGARRKNNPALIEKHTARFAALHYSALVRVLAAVAAADSVGEVCAEVAGGAKTGQAIVAVQSLLLTFFASAGAAVEKLRDAFAKPPANSKQHLFIEPADVVGSPNWFYDRRTQYVHKVLVPVFKRDGVLCFDAANFLDKEVDWNGDARRDVRELSEAIATLSVTFVSGMTSGWERLYSHLRRVAPKQPIVHMSSFVTPITSGSPYR